MSSASIQKLFCGIYSAFKCSFNEFVGEKVVSPSYSSAILGPPQSIIINPEDEKKEILSFETMWLDPEDVMKVKEVRQRNKFTMISLMCEAKKKTDGIPWQSSF